MPCARESSRRGTACRTLLVRSHEKKSTAGRTPCNREGRAGGSSLFPMLGHLRGDEQGISFATDEQERIFARLAYGLIELADVPDRLVVDFLDHITLP